MQEDYEESIFIDPEVMEFKETIRNARKKLETTNGSSHALQDKQEM